MADNFNLAKFLRNNRLLNESIGGYRDIKPMKEEISGEQSMTAGSDWEYKDDEFVTVVGEVPSALGVKVGDVIRNPNGSETLTVKRIVKKVNRGDDHENPKYPIYTAYLDSSIKAGRDEYPFDLYTLSKAIERGGYELNPMNEAEEEDAYFDYKNNRRSFLPSPDEFQGALDSSEMSRHNRMMGLAHSEFEDVSPIVKKTIDALRADGFDDQDIIDFLATDFSLDEEVPVSSSGVQMEGEEFNWKPINQQGKTPFKNLTVTITDDKIKVLADDGFSSQSYTKEDIKDAMKTGEYLRFRGHNLELNAKMKAWANS